jgi:hypothetical protein
MAASMRRLCETFYLRSKLLLMQIEDSNTLVAPFLDLSLGLMGARHALYGIAGSSLRHCWVLSKGDAEAADARLAFIIRAGKAV